MPLILLIQISFHTGELRIVPNPLSAVEGEASISYTLPDTSIDRVYYEIFDLFGNLVLKREFVSGEEGAKSGELNTVFWNGINGRGERVATGVYTVFIRAFQGTRLIFMAKGRIGVVW